MSPRQRSLYCLIWMALIGFTTNVLAGQRPDLLIADFEQSDYGKWSASGEAFGSGPAHGTLPGQMQVTGFEGKGLVNSFLHGDRSRGTLTSPPIKIERMFINFLIGGGGYKDTTCVNLLLDGNVVRTATGGNTQPGGSEALDWDSWDVHELEGKTAVVQIVDKRTAGWGHINVDQIIQSDRKRGAGPASRELVIHQRYLHLPVDNGARNCRMELIANGEPVRRFDIQLAVGKPDFWMYTDVSTLNNQKLRIAVDKLPYGSNGLDAIYQADSIPDAAATYHEKYRPQFHFSPGRGWTNDPNGLVYYEGKYHLFFQHNPYGTRWGNMTWGHATSPDLVHWTEGSDAIHPDKLGTIFSGSAVVDQHNTTRWQTGTDKPIVCIYTSAGRLADPPVPFTQSIAYSADQGRSWHKYTGNPVLTNINGSNRDPKVFWHKPTEQWVMILYLDQRGQFGLFGSPDLKSWKKLSDLEFPGGHECPDLFQLAVDGNPENLRWVAWEAGGQYMLGQFDGTTFKRESGPHRSKYGANDYAAQTYSDIPAADGRRIQIGWMSGGKYPDMPFNQQMTFPRVLTLRTTGEGIRLFFQPVKELEKLRGSHVQLGPTAVSPDQDPLPGITGELFEIQATLRPENARSIGLSVRGVRIEYDVSKGELTCLGKKAPLPLSDGRVMLHVLVDRTSLEVFANQGRIKMCFCMIPDESNQRIGVFATGSGARVESLDVWQLNSVWPTR